MEGINFKAQALELELSSPSSIPLEIEPPACSSSFHPVPVKSSSRLSFAERIRRVAKIRDPPEYIDPVTAGVVTPGQMESRLSRRVPRINCRARPPLLTRLENRQLWANLLKGPADVFRIISSA